MSSAPLPRYGVTSQNEPADVIDFAVESLRHFGYAVIDSGFSNIELQALGDAFDAARKTSFNLYGEQYLRSIDEHNTIRCLLVHDRLFLKLALNERVHSICKALIGANFILNQQNGIINPGDETTYNQAAYHRDLPYQHFVSSRPLAINALFCIDDFTVENGATKVIPASQKVEAFPSDQLVRSSEISLTAPAGSFLLLDCMAFHCGGKNLSRRDRRAVNHVFTIGLLRQQLDIPAILGEGYVSDAHVRRLLGYEFRCPTRIEAYYGIRAAKLGVNDTKFHGRPSPDGTALTGT
jgi:ectoine hydroxylase-related dioxygenase (phytanoyl-CoA dioxygenase family)